MVMRKSGRGSVLKEIMEDGAPGYSRRRLMTKSVLPLLLGLTSRRSRRGKKPVKTDTKKGKDDVHAFILMNGIDEHGPYSR